MEIPEADLDGERLLLGIVNNSTQRLVGKCAVPLRGMMPGRHYNLRLLLDTAGAICITGARWRAPPVCSPFLPADSLLF